MQNEQIPNKNRPQKSKSLWIISAVTTLFIGIMGYEIIRENNLRETAKPSEKKLPILSNLAKDPYQKADRVELTLLNAENHYLSNKIAALKQEAHENAKRLHTLQLSFFFAQKAKENEEMTKLKQLLEYDRHALLELQTSFENTEKEIAEMEQFKERFEKDQTALSSLKDNFNRTQGEIIVKEAQIAEMEATIAILHDLIDAKNAHSLSVETSLQNQLKEATDEKTRLAKQIFDLEVKETELKMTVQDHMAAIEKLQNDFDRSSFMTLDKELEVDLMAENLKAKQIKLNAQSKNLSFIIETEQLAADHLQKELHYNEAELAASFEKLKIIERELHLAYLESQEKEQLLEALNREITKKDEMISHAKWERDAFLQESKEALAKWERVLSEKEAEATEKAVAGLHEFSIHEAMGSSLLDELHKKQTELDQLKIVHNALSHDRNALKNLIDEKNQDIENLEKKASLALEKHESLNLFLQENINTLTANLDSELYKTKELERKIEHYESLVSQIETLNKIEKENAYAIESELEDVKSQLKVRIEELSLANELNALKEQEMSALLARHENEMKEMQAKIELSQDERIAFNDKLTQDLAHYQRLLEEKTENAYALEKELEALNDKFAGLQEQSHEELNTLLARHASQMQEMQAQLELHQAEKLALNEKWAEDLEKHSNNSLAIQKEMEEVIALKEQEISRLATLHESEMNEMRSMNTEKLVLNEQELNALAARHASQMQELQAQLELHQAEKLALNEKWAEDLEKHSNNSLALQKEMEEVIALKEQEISRLATLHESEMNEMRSMHAEKLSSNEKLTEDLAHYQKLLEEKTENAYALERQLEELNSQLKAQADEFIALKEQSNEELSTLLVHHESEIKEMRSWIESTQTEKIALSDKLAEDFKAHASDLSALQNEMQELASLKEQELNALIARHESEMMEMQAKVELSQTEKIALNEKSVKDLERYQSLLDDRTTNFHALQKQMEELSSFLAQRESELDQVRETSARWQQSNEELSELLSFHENKMNEIESSHAEKIALNEKLSADIEKYQKLLDEKANDFYALERKLDDLNTLLAKRESELNQILEMAALKEQSHKELSEEFSTLLTLRENKLADAEQKAWDIEQSLSQLTALLGARDLENEKLSHEMQAYKDEIAQHLEAQATAQHKTHDHEQQLTSLIEFLIKREEELMEALRQTKSEKMDVESASL